MAFEMQVQIAGLQKIIAQEEIKKRPTFELPATLRGTRQEISTFLLNNHQKCFDGAGATIYYGLQDWSPVPKENKRYKIVSAGTDLTDMLKAGFELAKYAKEKVVDSVTGGDGKRMELLVSHKRQDFLEPKNTASSESRLLGFSNLVSAVWGKAS